MSGLNGRHSSSKSSHCASWRPTRSPQLIQLRARQQQLAHRMVTRRQISRVINFHHVMMEKKKKKRRTRRNCWRIMQSASNSGRPPVHCHLWCLVLSHIPAPFFWQARPASRAFLPGEYRSAATSLCGWEQAVAPRAVSCMACLLVAEIWAGECM